MSELFHLTTKVYRSIVKFIAFTLFLFIYISSFQPSVNVFKIAEASGTEAPISFNYSYDKNGNITSRVVPNTPPATPTNPYPADGAIDEGAQGSPLTITIRWECTDSNSGDILSYDIYLDEDQSLVNNKDASALASQDQASSSYQSPVDYGRTYF